MTDYSDHKPGEEMIELGHFRPDLNSPDETLNPNYTWSDEETVHIHSPTFVLARFIDDFISGYEFLEEEYNTEERELLDDLLDEILGAIRDQCKHTYYLADRDPDPNYKTRYTCIKCGATGWK